MGKLKDLHWPLVLGLGALALVRPLVNIITDQTGAPRWSLWPIAITIVISAVWIAVVGLTRVARPVLTLVCVGVVYAVLSMLLAAVLSPLLTGQLQGPLADPVAVVPILLINALWGLVAGLIALSVRRARVSR